MKQLLLFLLSFSLLAAAQAQNGQIRPEQIQGTTPGYILVAGSDGLYHSQISPYLLVSDSSKYVTPSGLAVVAGKVPISQTFSGGILTTTLANGNTIQTTLDGRYALLSTIGQPNGLVPLDANSKIPSIYLPAQSGGGGNIYVDSSQAQMTAHSGANVGDISKRVDVQKNFVLQSLPSSNAANWVELYQGSGIQFVNGKSGSTVSLTTADIPENVANLYFTNSRARSAISASAPHLQYNNVTGVISMVATGQAAGTYNSMTIDQYGLVSSATNIAYLTAADLSGYATISQLTTPGGIAIPAANITGLPSAGGTESYEEFTSSTSSSITLAHIPLSTSIVKIYQNGQLKKLSLRTVSGTSVTLGFTRTSADIISADYNY